MAPITDDGLIPERLTLSGADLVTLDYFISNPVILYSVRGSEGAMGSYTCTFTYLTSTTIGEQTSHSNVRTFYVYGIK